MIGSLLYLTASRPDIVFAVGLCARFQSSPKESHLTAVKRIFRYLVGTTDLGLWYGKGSHFDFVAYCDADYAGDKMERKSTSGACQFLGEALISWSCRKQNTIALSTTEAEYVSAANCCSQVLWIKNQLEDYSVRYSHIPIYCDNTSEIELIFVDTNNQLADIFTKPLVEETFNSIKKRLNIMQNPGQDR
ncbi:secreted RxLR effector protein 161-like [Cicer arietinum]|uniref:secreted RxLR effector protein 161-like n=1 Tax=Cicer arietinum TaxID=3827 RepID=UPI003CC67AAB